MDEKKAASCAAVLGALLAAVLVPVLGRGAWTQEPGVLTSGLVSITDPRNPTAVVRLNAVNRVEFAAMRVVLRIFDRSGRLLAEQTAEVGPRAGASLQVVIRDPAPNAMVFGQVMHPTDAGFPPEPIVPTLEVLRTFETGRAGCPCVVVSDFVH